MSKNKVYPEVEEAEDGNNVLKKVLKYQHTVLAIFGLYHGRESNLALKAYCIFVAILQWINFFKFINAFEFVQGNSETFDVLLVLKIVCFLWLFGCSANNTILFVIQHQKTKILHFSTCFDELFHFYQEMPQREIHYIKRITIIATSLALVCSLFNSITCFVSLFGPKEFYDAFSLMTTPFHRQAWVKDSVPYKLFCSILILYASTSWLLTISYYFNYCFLIGRLLNNFNKNFKQFTIKNEISIKELLYKNELGFEELRRWHLKLGTLIRILNSCFQELISIQLIVFVPIVFLILHIMSDWSGNCVTGLYTILYPFWLVMATLILVLVITNAGRINTKFHLPLKEIFNLQVCNFSNSSSFKVEMMISKLIGDKTGLTTWGFFVIDRAFILSVCGTIISYFIIMTRFKSQNTC